MGRFRVKSLSKLPCQHEIGVYQHTFLLFTSRVCGTERLLDLLHFSA